MLARRPQALSHRQRRLPVNYQHVQQLEITFFMPSSTYLCTKQNNKQICTFTTSNSSSCRWRVLVSELCSDILRWLIVRHWFHKSHSIGRRLFEIIKTELLLEFCLKSKYMKIHTVKIYGDYSDHATGLLLNVMPWWWFSRNDHLLFHSNFKWLQV